MNSEHEVFEIVTTSKEGRLNEKRKSVGKYSTPDELHGKITELQDEGKTFSVVNAEAKVERVYRRERKNYRVTTSSYKQPKPAKKRTTPKQAKGKKQDNTES